MSQKEVRPDLSARATTTATTTEADAAKYIAGLRRRRNAAWRSSPLECGCRDGWTCRHSDRPTPSEKHLNAFRDAALHLMSYGLTPAPLLPEARELWRRNGDDRQLALTIIERWEEAA